MKAPITLDSQCQSYQSLVESYGYEILTSISLGSYQGDMLMIVGNNNRQYALFVTGYGSCSGCDALCACDVYDDDQKTIKNLEKLRENMCSGIIFSTPNELIEKLDTKDWAGEYYGGSTDSAEFREFIRNAKEQLIIRQLAQL